MIIYATHAGGRYLAWPDSLREQPTGKRSLYVNITNRCNCACVFCLRHKKQMAENSSLWLKKEPTVDEVKNALATAPWEYVSEIVFCGFGEPTLRQAELVALLHHVKETYGDHPTRLNTNGLGDLANGRAIASDFDGILDTVSISLNASNAERYLELTRAEYGIKSFEAMLKFARDCQKHVPNVVLTIVEPEKIDQNSDAAGEIARCRRICAERDLTLRIRTYEDR